MTSSVLQFLISLVSGPYHTFKTFHDYFNLPFAANAECWKPTFQRLKTMPLLYCLYMMTVFIWPWQYALTDEFYVERSWLYRLYYIWPIFLGFRLQVYCAFILLECMCTVAGFGAYPKELDSICGYGPSKLITLRAPEDENMTLKPSRWWMLQKLRSASRSVKL
jgi:lysophospholipid acyltransferase 7